MSLERPDLSNIPADVVGYIEALEAEVEQLRGKPKRPAATPATPIEPSEPPTTVNIITATRQGIIKRTPRHLYTRQRRSGMGIFDLENSEEDPPVFLVAADIEDRLIVITTQARVFSINVNKIEESPVRSRGQSISKWLPLEANEQPAAMLPYKTEGAINVLTDRGHVRRFRYHLFKETAEPGKKLFDIREIGQPKAACWGSDADLFIATQQGRAIRFAEDQVTVRGCLGIRLAEGDEVVAITPVSQRSGVFLLGADGKGIIRQMSGFNANKAPGSGGKNALKTDHLITAMTIKQGTDLFIISRLSKIIRFHANEVSTTEGVVQGVNCMALRSDEVMTAIQS